MRRLVLAVVFLAVAVSAVPAFAQNPLVGTWDSVSRTVDGKEVPPATRADGIQPGVSRYTYTADGFYVALTIPKGRPQITTPQAQWTKEDWQGRYQGVSGQYGTYSVSGDKVTFKQVSAMAPENEGKDRVVTFRKDGADLLVTSIGTNGSKTETRFRPAK
jgi:hypothetical protein